MLEAVIDANVLVSGLMRESKTRVVIRALIDNKFRLVTSDDLLNELAYTLRKPRLASLIDETDSAILFSLIKERARFVNPSRKVNICRDPKDNPVLECALEAKALVVSGDADLLVLSPFNGIKVLTPREFMDLLKGGK